MAKSTITTAAKTKTEAKPRAKAKPRIPAEISYDFEITDWHLSYGIATGNDRRFARGPYAEYLTLELMTVMVEPVKFQGRRVQFTLLGKREIDLQINADYPRPAIHMGTLHMRGDRSSYLGEMPLTAIWGLVPALDAERIKVIHLSGEPLHHGSASIRFILFERDFGEE